MNNASMADVCAIGPQSVDPDTGKISLSLGKRVSQMKRVEFFSPDEHAEACLGIVLSAADTNRVGDGVVSISPVEKLVKINGKVTLEG